MAANGIAEQEATEARLRSHAGGRVWAGALDDGAEIPRDEVGRIAPHIIIDYGATIRSSKDRKLDAPEAGQPHILPAIVYCVAGDYDSARDLSGDVFDDLIDWAPSDTSDPWRPEGGFGSRRPQTSNTPTRFIRILFWETTINVD